MKTTSLYLAACFTLLTGFAIILNGCNSDGTMNSDFIKNVENFGGDIGKGVASLGRVHTAFHKMNEEFRPIDEYYLGRASAAQLIAQYGLYNNDAATRYVNVVGQTVAEFSKKPGVYNGYRFAILNSDDVNAFACPGAFILVTKGLLRCAATEDELAAVLAHEIGHIQNDHALLAISKSRHEKFLAVLFTEGVKTASPEYRDQVGDILDGMADDVLNQLKNGYSKDQEFQADADGVAILKETGYDPNAMTTLLTRMETKLKAGAADFSSTHPKTSDRIDAVKKAVGGVTPMPLNAARQQRFTTALAAVRAQ